MPDLHVPRKIRRIHQLLLDAGATDVLFVGGFVRDHVLGIPSKDFDLEIYGLSYEQIIAAIRPHFRIDQVGQSFSVLKVDQEIDLAIPRRERKTGTGHKAFEVVPDSTMTFREAAARRDFTINAIGMRLDGTFVDPYDGLGDLKRGILRAPTEAFCEDPLRVLRGMQFAARFGFTMEPRTVDFCRRVLPEFGTLSAERLYTEWEKWALKGHWPEKGLDLLRETGWLECFPTLNHLTQVELNPEIHPEGNAWEHTRRVCIAAARLAERFQLPQEERLHLMLAALLHDVGRPEPEHAKKGAKLTEDFLLKLRAPLAVMKSVRSLVLAHGFHAHRELSETHVRRLSVLLTPSNIRLWHLLISADEEGRGTAEPEAKTHWDEWLQLAETLGISEHQPDQILQGRDLEAFGIKPGPEMGKILKKAWEAQLDGAFLTHEAGVEWLKKEL
ncbi:MAG: HD domain-containing protein [Thermoguttaceae bacterium]|nr:HD domain-containing protein [Thermoguttaceae bacterium]